MYWYYRHDLVEKTISKSIFAHLGNSSPEMFYKIVVLENFAKFSGKLIFHKLFWIKFDLRSETLSKRALCTGTFMWTSSVVTPKKKSAVASSVPSLSATSKIQCDRYLFFHKFDQFFFYISFWYPRVWFKFPKTCYDFKTMKLI